MNTRTLNNSQREINIRVSVISKHREGKISLVSVCTYLYSLCLHVYRHTQYISTSRDYYTHKTVYLFKPHIFRPDNGTRNLVSIRQNYIAAKTSRKSSKRFSLIIKWGGGEKNSTSRRNYQQQCKSDEKKNREGWKRRHILVYIQIST